MSEYDNLENILPVGPLKIAALEGCREFGKTVDGYLTKSRQDAVKKHPSLAKASGLCGRFLSFELQLPALWYR